MAGYVFSVNGTSFDPDGRSDVTASEIEAHNKALEAAELAQWATAPDGWHCYFKAAHSGAMVTTQLGTPIGRITSATHYRSNVWRARMVAFTILGTNGATYHGRAGIDNTQLLRLRKSKG